MSSNKLLLATLLPASGLAIAASSYTLADSTTSAQPASQGDMPLPPGWTADDMQAVVAAGTPGKMQEYLAQDAGTWRGKTTMTMYPGAEPMTSECTSTITPIMDGRYTKIEMAGEMPGMGAFTGLGIAGFG